MKKEDLTTRLVRNFFHIQGPFDECRQEVIYKACARSMVQIFLLFLHSLPVLSVVWALYRDSSNGYALSLLLDDFCPQSQGKIFY